MRSQNLSSDLVDGIWDSYKRGVLLDLRRENDAAAYPKLRKLDARGTAEILIGRQIAAIQACKSCKRISTTAGSKGKTCHFHMHRIQKLYFLFQEMHGFGSDSPLAVTPKEHGPYQEGLDVILGSSPLDSWGAAKGTASALGFGPVENRIIHNLVTIYDKLSYNDIEVLTSRIYIDQHPELGTEWGFPSTYEIAAQSKLKEFEPILDTIGTAKSKSPIDDILGFIESHYPSSEEWEKERDLVRSAVTSLVQQLQGDLEFSGALPTGSSGILMIVKDENLQGLDGTNLLSVLKFPRPRSGLFRPANLQALSEESSKMSLVIHPNIVRVLRANYVEISSGTRLPWFTMEYVNGASNLRDFIGKKPSRTQLLAVLVDVARGLDYLHSKHIVHCDLKDENILVRAVDHPQGLITDLGYAHMKSGEEKEILVRYTDRTAHPFLKGHRTRDSDPAAATAKILRADLAFDFDLYAFGKTLADLLPAIEHLEILDPFDLKYLNLIILRLLRGFAVDRPMIRGVTEEITQEIQYHDSRELVEDFVRFGI